jgi:hypothetical protein
MPGRREVGPDPAVHQRASLVERLLPETAPRPDRAAGEDVDEHVEPLLLPGDAFEERRHFGVDMVVHADGDPESAGGGDPLRGFLDRFGAARVVVCAGVRLRAAAAAGAVHRRAGFAEHLGDPSSTTTGGAGDEGDASFEWLHGELLPHQTGFVLGSQEYK